jgi:hypothetical protein
MSQHANCFFLFFKLPYQTITLLFSFLKLRCNLFSDGHLVMSFFFIRLMVSKRNLRSTVNSILYFLR